MANVIPFPTPSRPRCLRPQLCAGCSNPETREMPHVERNGELVCPSCAFYVDEQAASVQK